METIRDTMVFEDIIKTIHRLFKLNVLHSTPIKRGWLNLKWKITTDSGQQFLLKQYNKKRYSLFNSEDLLFAFSQQIRLKEQGLACPKLLSHNGNVLFISDNEEIFMVMEYCPGQLVGPGRSNAHQSYDLGRATGKMHRLLNDGTLGVKHQPKFIPPSREERLAHWNLIMEQTKESDKVQLLAAIETQRIATEEIHIEVLESLRLGWAHRDLWVDYPQLDVARAVISCALDDHLDVSLS
ncbi:phosphotransferase [Paenibacillaceae bacterium WGS1546]|uniref:phosphotransferase n=1 Tax=Cohnella sp. WGS1546 TaxID=3366810 RepID=UPI00372D2628